MKRASVAAIVLVTIAATGAGTYALGTRAGQASVWQYIGPGDVTCDTDIADVPDCWELPDHPGN